jgi:alcohol dehydrogenase class IV
LTDKFAKAYELLRGFKGDTYLSGYEVLSKVGEITTGLGKRAALIRDAFPGSEPFTSKLQESLSSAGIELLEVIDGAAPNAPRDDLFRITDRLKQIHPDVLVSFGGGSTIDVVKAAAVLCALGGEIDDYFGIGLVTQALTKQGKKLTPHVAVQAAASSAAHLTKYSNITDLKTGQKKLIVDLAIVPQKAVFDYEVTFTAPTTLTADGALDGVSHALEVLYSAVGKPYYGFMEEVAYQCIGLVMEYLPRVLENPRDREGRQALALATDLGGYSIMIGGTNGAHLTSFSLIDILSHGRACILMNPYYTVFYSPAVQAPLRLVGHLCQQAGYAGEGILRLSGRDLAEAVAESLRSLERRVSVPTTLAEVRGFTDAHIERALRAAKDPQLKMKLENMPVPITAEMVDEYMRPVLEAAKTGDLSRIKLVPA